MARLEELEKDKDAGLDLDSPLHKALSLVKSVIKHTANDSEDHAQLSQAMDLLSHSQALFTPKLLKQVSATVLHDVIRRSSLKARLKSMPKLRVGYLPNSQPIIPR